MTQKLSANFQVTSRRQGNTARVALSGELDIATTGELERALTELEGTQPARIVLDLGDLTFMDVTGLHIILTAARRADQMDVPFVLCRPRANIRRLLELTEADQELDFSDEDDTTPSPS